MHHPVAVVFSLAVIAFLIAVMATKRPQKPLMKTAMAAAIVGLFTYSVYGMAQRGNVELAVFFVVVMIATLVWRSFKRWDECWRQL
jgi:uncharacterized membrane protein